MFLVDHRKWQPASLARASRPAKQDNPSLSVALAASTDFAHETVLAVRARPALQPGG